jgi:hypothetical protein
MASNVQVAVDDTDTEQTPLLPKVDSDAPPKQTRLPTFQILILLSVRLTEIMTSTSIAPYINQVWLYPLLFTCR